MSNEKKPVYGGQAVIEGVMMRGRRSFAVAVRNPEGEIVIHSEPLNPAIYDSFISKTPFVRGLTMLWDALGIGMKSLMYSAEISSEIEGEEPQEAAESVFDMQTLALYGTVALSLTLSVSLFIALPAFLAELLVPGDTYFLLSNLVEGIIKLVLVIGYIWVIGFMPDIQRVYGYHGAEHKTIHAFEAQAELTPETVQTFPLEHPRCGTGFLLTVVAISIVLFTFVPAVTEYGRLVQILIRVGTRILLIPVVAGIAYEYLRFTAERQSNRFIRTLTRPNLALQKLTTRQPDEGMLEVAIAAFEKARAYDLAAETKPEEEVAAT